MSIGVDLLRVSRFTRAVASERARRRVFTANELARAGRYTGRRAEEWLAYRFCAKEAVAKALRRGLGQGLLWQDIEIAQDEYGAPVVVLTGGARRIAEAAGIVGVEVTLTHQEDWAISFAMAVRRTGGTA